MVLRTGTNPLNSDTNRDGLSEGDELTSVGTDPLNPDTDADTFLDGIDACPLAPENFNGVQDNDGCPDASGTEIYVKPSSINPRAKGVIPVVVFGSFALDVTDINLSTLAFGRCPGSQRPQLRRHPRPCRLYSSDAADDQQCV